MEPMRKGLERVLVVQADGELARYTCALLDDIGFRHIIHAPDLAHAEKLWSNAISKARPFQLIVCDDEVSGGAMGVHQLTGTTPMVIFSTPQNPRNLRLAARIGIKGLVFRPYGREQIARAMETVLQLS